MTKKKRKPYSGSRASMLEKEQSAKISEEIYSFTYKAQYLKAFQVAKKALKQLPDNRFVQYHYAVLLGDSEEWASVAQQKVNAKKASRLLMDLLKRARGIDPRWRNQWRNEYYWFSKQPYKQWRLGLENLKDKSFGGGYSMGVGAVSLALKLYEQGKPKRAVKWAKKAVSAWENYHKTVPNYYNSHVWDAQARGLAGDLAGMEKTLKKAARLAKRPLSYREFRTARDAVKKVFSVKNKESED